MTKIPDTFKYDYAISWVAIWAYVITRLDVFLIPYFAGLAICLFEIVYSYGQDYFGWGEDGR